MIVKFIHPQKILKNFLEIAKSMKHSSSNLNFIQYYLQMFLKLNQKIR
jgi:hypothetical protein